MNRGGIPHHRAEFVAHDLMLQFRRLNHVHGGAINPKWPAAVLLML
jgi:hypothetical protein